MWVVMVLFAAFFATGVAVTAHDHQETAELQQKVRLLEARLAPKPKTLDGMDVRDLQPREHHE